MAEKEINDKQKTFIGEYLVDLNATAAAIRAGYSAKNADKIAYNLMQNPRIKDALDIARAKLSRRVGISQERVVNEYAKIAFADIKDFVDFRTEKTFVGQDDDGNPVFDYKQIVDVKPSSEVDGTLISEVSIARDGTLKFKLHDKGAALDKLGKHLGMFVDRHEVTGKDGGPITTALDYSQLSNEQLLEIVSNAKNIVKKVE